MVPLRLEPVFVPRIWGSRSLAPLFPEKVGLSEPVGEVWLTGDACRLANGPWAGRDLGAAWREMPVEWRGSRCKGDATFPLLVKFLFPEDKLSIQVHPDDDYARAHENGSTGKTEMWYVVDARAGAEVFVGLKAGTTVESVRRGLGDGTLESQIQRVPLRRGEAIFVPAGTVHTIGPGLVLCEIQENSDVTYRLFDYNRLTAEGKPRELHVEKALEVIRFGQMHGGPLQPVRRASQGVEETYWKVCRHFATEEWKFERKMERVVAPERFELLIFLEGCGEIESGTEAFVYERAQVWMLPARLGSYWLVAKEPTRVLRTYVPDIEREFVGRMKELGVAEAEWSRIVSR